jgi:rare lipoprotein A
VYVTVTDRGPFHKNRHIDLTRAAFWKIRPSNYGGHIDVNIEIVKK